MCDDLLLTFDDIDSQNNAMNTLIDLYVFGNPEEEEEEEEKEKQPLAPPQKPQTDRGNAGEEEEDAKTPLLPESEQAPDGGRPKETTEYLPRERKVCERSTLADKIKYFNSFFGGK